MTSDRVRASRRAGTPLRIAGRRFDSRQLVGTGKFATPQGMAQALDALAARS